MITILQIIRLSPVDPLWVTLILLVSYTAFFAVVLAWSVDMVTQLVRRRRPWRVGRQVTWSWAFAAWMVSLVASATIAIGRVLLNAHIRELNDIGEWYRGVQVVSTLCLAILSGIAYHRYRHPIDPIADEGVFGAVARSFPVVVADGGGVIRFTSPWMDALYGGPPRALVGQPITALMPARYHDAHRSGMARYQATREPRLIGRLTPIELLRHDGTELPVELALSSAMDGGTEWFCGQFWQREPSPPS